MKTVNSLEDCALPKKTKLLIALVLDNCPRCFRGSPVAGQQAMKAGVSKEEMAEALRVVEP
jgi:alkylhydroperoxidase/carboxymuconolactone decarboxylase family protein YurZ